MKLYFFFYKRKKNPSILNYTNDTDIGRFRLNNKKTMKIYFFLYIRKKWKIPMKQQQKMTGLYG